MTRVFLISQFKIVCLGLYLELFRDRSAERRKRDKLAAFLLLVQGGRSSTAHRSHPSSDCTYAFVFVSAMYIHGISFCPSLIPKVWSSVSIASVWEVNSCLYLRMENRRLQNLTVQTVSGSTKFSRKKTRIQICINVTTIKMLECHEITNPI